MRLTSYSYGITDNDVSKGSFAYTRVRTAFAGGNEALTLAVLGKAQRLQDRGDSRNGYYRYHPREDFISSGLCHTTLIGGPYRCLD